MTRTNLPQYYQYTPLSKPLALSRLMKTILDLNVHIIFDIEDSVQDTLNPENTPKLKAKARESLIHLADIRKEYFNQGTINIRLNAQSTSEYPLDLEAIGKIAPHINIEALWLPMVDSSEQIKSCHKDFSKIGLKNFKIIPIVETLAGVKNLPEILSNTPQDMMMQVHYGHYDYCLDSETFPFTPQNEKSFWKLINNFVKVVEAGGRQYIHTPMGDLYNDELFMAIDTRLEEICSKGFGRACLNLNQSKLIKRTDYSILMNEKETHLSDTEKEHLAHKMIEEFENYRCSKRSFSLKEGQFITPHEYKSAHQFLKRIKCASA